MRRYARKNSNAVCIIPRNAITWIILTMSILTIFSFLLIEVRRITSKKNYLFNELTQNSTTVSDISRSIAYIESCRPCPNPNENFTLTLFKTTWNSNTIEALFEDNPVCFEKMYLLILVTSASENFERRDAIRKTWAKEERWRLRHPKLKWKTVFLVGQPSEMFLNILLKNERDMSGDMLIGEYLDTYRNLTLKVMHGLKWAAQNCQPEFLLKTDDDCFVNVPLLLQFLSQFNPTPHNLYAGRVRWSAPVIRDQRSQWYVSSFDYPKPRYAPYANGAGYILSRDVLLNMVLFSDKVPIFPNEDAYVGTVLNLAGIKPTHSGRFVTHKGPWQVCNYLYLFVVHRVKASLQNAHQEMANKAIDSCSNDVMKDWV